MICNVKCIAIYVRSYPRSEFVIIEVVTFLQFVKLKGDCNGRINEAVKLSIKENECLTRNGNLFPGIYIADRYNKLLHSFLKDENGNLKKSAVRWNPYAEGLIADDWELAE